MANQAVPLLLFTEIKDYIMRRKHQTRFVFSFVACFIILCMPVPVIAVETSVLSVDEEEMASAENEPKTELPEQQIEDVTADVMIGENLPFEPGDHIYFYNIEGGAGSSDMILLESNGHWGLIDAGHRYDTSITDENGNSWATNVSGLSCQVAGKNGRDAMLYMIRTLGIEHLDFIVGTHAHSDHIGGIPEIAELLVSNGEDEPHSLIDETTVYFYKTYFHTGSQDDDLGDTTIKYSWHNQAFYYQARQAIISHDGILVDVGCGLLTKDGEGHSVDQSDNLSAISDSGNLTDVSYEEGAEDNPYDDRISFQWGDMDIDLYHLFSVDGALNENANAMQTVVTCNGYNICLTSDIDTQFQTEQKLAKEIANDHGTFDVVKMAHHGIYDGSNSKGFLDCLQPKIMISTNHWTDITSPTIVGAYSSAKYYAQKNYGTVVYGTGVSDRMLALDLDGQEIAVYNVTGDGEEAVIESGESCRDSGLVQDGWSKWYIEYNTAFILDWFYFKDNEAMTGWQIIDGKKYHFADNGLMDKGWLQDGAHSFYLNSYALTGWREIDGVWYYFNADGSLCTNGWAKDSKGWCWMNASGKITRGKWIQYKKEWYCLKENGYMAANEWAKDSNGWCWMDVNGRPVKNKWIKDKGKNYYIKSNGYMAKNEWIRYRNKWYWAKSNGQCS